MTRLSKKICLLGDSAVGKTSLARRFVYGIFEDKIISAIGVKVSRKTLGMTSDAGVVELSMLIWDLAGSDEFEPIHTSYLRGAEGAILVCDRTRADTLESLRVYASELRQINPNVKFVVAANKHDLVSRYQVSEDAIRNAAEELQAPYYLTSAKTGATVETLFRRLGQLLVA